MIDQQLWFSAHDGIEFRAAVNHLHARQDAGDLFGGELRITMNGELVFRELFHDQKQLHRRSQELFERIVGAFRPELP